MKFSSLPQDVQKEITSDIRFTGYDGYFLYRKFDQSVTWCNHIDDAKNDVEYLNYEMVTDVTQG